MSILEGPSKLQRGHRLMIGDIVNDCKYRDQKIKEIIPKFAGKELKDFTLILENGSCCSWMDCCNLPDEIPEGVKR